jgi:Outer membrane protein beta-barrel domain
MKKTILLIITASIFINNANSQITKGNWMVGGNFNYSKSKTSGTYASDKKFREIDVLPSIGYFAFNKTALGIKAKLYFTKEKLPQPNGTEISSVQNNLGIGPFARYYFLPAEKMVNVYLEGNTFYKETTVKSPGSTNAKFKAFDYSFVGGLVLFLNSSVGIEFSLGYYNSKAINLDGRGEDLKFGIGFQIHLERDKN